MQTAETNRLIAFAALLVAAFTLAYVGGWLLKPAVADREPPERMDHQEMPTQTPASPRPTGLHGGHGTHPTGSEGSRR